MERTFIIVEASNGLIVTNRSGSGLTAHENVSVYLDFISMKRAVDEQLEAFNPAKRHLP